MANAPRKPRNRQITASLQIHRRPSLGRTRSRGPLCVPEVLESGCSGTVPQIPVQKATPITSLHLDVNTGFRATENRPEPPESCMSLILISAKPGTTREPCGGVFLHRAP